MKLSLEKVNKIILLAALIALIYREGNFAVTFIPKPFETTLVLLCFSTLFFLLKNGKVKDFFASIPRNILIALCVLIGSVFLGWFSAFLSGTPTSFNMILELGTFLMGFATFLLVLFYTKGDDGYAKRCLYALLVPSIYAFLLFLPAGGYLGIDLNIQFLGFTVNPNTVAKILLIPAMYFAVHLLFQSGNKWLKVLYIFLLSSMVSLVLWTGSRGGLLSLGAGLIFLLAIYIFRGFSWKKMFLGTGIIFTVFILGFGLLPRDRREPFAERVVFTFFHPSGAPVPAPRATAGADANPKQDFEPAKAVAIKLVEPRLIIWPFYAGYVFSHPLGIGPNTHKNFRLVDNNGMPINSGPHNTYLQIWLWGGVLGILSFLFILFSGFKNLWNRLKISFNKTDLALLSILFALTVSFFFDDSLSFYWFFVILALALRERG